MSDKEIDNGIKLFEYLEKLSLLNINIRNNIKKLSGEECVFNLEDEESFPVIKNIFLKNRLEKKWGDQNDSSENFLSIERYKIEKPPVLPKELENWIDYDSIDFIKPEPKEFIIVTEYFKDNNEREKAFKDIKENGNNPILLGWIKKDSYGNFEKIEEITRKIFFKDIHDLESIYNDWIEMKWKVWKEKNYQYYLVNQTYDKFFSLRSFLKTELDNYDLLWGHDILTWKNGNSEIYYPTLFTPVSIELDAEKNTIFIKKDISIKSFFDISFIREALNEEASRNLVDIDSLADRINLQINKGEINVWDYELMNKYFQELLHYISPEGESRYYNRTESIEFKKYPTSFNHHNLFLFKKSGKSWADYAKKIQEDIKKNNNLTPFLEDLVYEQTFSREKDNQKEDKEIDGELYFSLPYNDEQKKIANRIDAEYGAVVQGPPGTGKTHTIANLISRFLALGKNVLVTSQTGQALSVVKNKLPKNIRNIVVSQVESNNKGSDLQSSVLEINAILSENTKFTEKKLDQAKNELRDIREKIMIKNNEFSKKSLLDSNEEIIIGVEKMTPMGAAKFISSFQDSEEFKILDDVDYKKELTITQKQINDYILALSCVEDEVWDFVKMDEIPSLEELPSLKLLEEYFELKRDLSSEEVSLIDFYIPKNEDLMIIDNIEKEIKDFEKNKKKVWELEKYLDGKEFFIKNNTTKKYFFDTIKEDFIVNINIKLKEILKVLKSFDEPWEEELFKTVKNLNERKRWEKFYLEFNNLSNEYRKNDEISIGKKISLKNNYNIDYLKAIEIISKILENSKDGKIKKGIFIFDFSIRNFVRNVYLNDKEIETVEEAKILNSFFLKIKIEKDLRRIWEEAFSLIINKKEFLIPFNIVWLENLLSTIDRLIHFEKNNNEIKNELHDLKFFDEIDLTNIKFVEEAINIFEGFDSYFKMIKIDKYINQTILSFEKEGAHKIVYLLIDSIKQKNIKNILSIKKEIVELNKKKNESLKYSEIEKNIFNERMISLKSNSNNHKDVLNYFNNIELGKIKDIGLFYKKIPELIDKQNRSKEIKIIEDQLKIDLPNTINKIKLSLKNREDVSLDIEKNWKWKRLINWLDFLHSGDSISKISKDLEILKNKEMDMLKNVVEISACLHLKNKVEKPQREALASFALSMKKYGKGTGKYASKHLSDARKALEIGKGAVPVWIMPINTIHQLFPNPTAGMFDVVIFDEASQVDARGLNVAYIGKKLLVVGDDEQVSPTSFTTQSKVTDLITRYICDVPNSCHFSNTSSLFDIAKIKMTDIITLTEHFRSVEEIIGFSNLLSYDGKLKVLRDQLPKYKLNPILETVFVENGFEDTNMKINKPEAERIIEKLKEILQDKKYEETDEEGESRPLTIGVISLLGKDQSKYLTDLISKNISSKEIEKRKIVCGDPYVFQGDERDIMLISMVKALDLHNPGLSITPYSISKKEYKQRINVAMSRAKNKMILFHSIPREKILNKDDLRKRILDWFYNYKAEERIFGLKKVREEVERGRASEFEYEVAKIIINRGYKIIPQYEVAGYRIDLVVQGEDAKLAIECDGDQYHNRIDKWEEDIERQQILERAGWNFWRLTGSSFYKNREDSLLSLWEKLKEMGITSDFET
ncbi:MAG: AAA domain-containing protein [Bacilli bacterium]|nr:AAA domain-containing protein [Bacilli bacterium]